jgi:hypothetical protein
MAGEVEATLAGVVMIIGAIVLFVYVAKVR